MNFPKLDDSSMAAPKTIHACPNCGEGRRWRSTKEKSGYTWLCEQCGAWYSEKDGRLVLIYISRDEPDPAIRCPECQSPMRKVTGSKIGDFYWCSRYPGCKDTIDLQDDGALAPVCQKDPAHGYMRRIKDKTGLFWVCRKYPNCGSRITIAQPEKSVVHEISI